MARDKPSKQLCCLASTPRVDTCWEDQEPRMSLWVKFFHSLGKTTLECISSRSWQGRTTVFTGGVQCTGNPCLSFLSFPLSCFTPPVDESPSFVATFLKELPVCKLLSQTLFLENPGLYSSMLQNLLPQYLNLYSEVSPPWKFIRNYVFIQLLYNYFLIVYKLGAWDHFKASVLCRVSCSSIRKQVLQHNYKAPAAGMRNSWFQVYFVLSRTFICPPNSLTI